MNYYDGHTDNPAPWIADMMPRILPPHWRLREHAADGAKWEARHGLTVIASGATELDGRRWWHVSVAHPRRLPTWEELREVKDLFIGRDRKAIQVLPRQAEYVNIHPHCLHLWHCLDDDGLPYFTAGSGSL